MLNLRSAVHLYVAVIVVVGLSQAARAVSVAYITGNTEPWNQPSNQQDLNTAFGGGNWDQFTFGNAISGGVFSGSYDFLYFDGGDGTTLAFEGFINSNRSTLEAWVADGGVAFLNAARWNDTAPFDLGFDAALTSGPSGSGTAVDPMHPIFVGPNGSAGTIWTGSSFAHDYIAWAGGTPLIVNGGKVLLAESSWGDGHILLGGMTSSYFHTPNAPAHNLRANILDYGASLAEAEVVPAPAAIGAGFVGFALLALRRGRRGRIETV